MMMTAKAMTAAAFLAAGVLCAQEPRLEVISLKPNKIVYEDGEAGRARVRLANPFDRELAVTLKPVLLWDLEKSLALAPVAVTVPAKDNAEGEVSWPGVTERWGHELRVEAVAEGRTVDVGRQFFGVNSEWMDLILISFPRQAYKDRGLLMAEEPFSTYSTVQHWFAWAPGDYAENAPAYDEWYSGQTGYHMKKGQIREAIRDCHEKGMRCTFYNNAFSSGKAGLEWARRHPEWVCRRRDGTPSLGGSALALSKPHSDKATGKMGFVQIDFFHEKCIEYGARNVIESIEMFGWDGMFWDCGGCALFPGFSYDGQPTPHGRDPDALSARNYRLLHNLIREKHPHFGVWINGSIDHFKQPFWSRFGNGGGLAMIEEQLRLPQTALLCEHRHHEQPGSRFSNWQRCHDQYAKERDAVTQRLGAPIIAGYTTPWGWTAESHLGALLLATQIRPANCHQEGTWPMTQFMTRYSALLWRRDVKVIDDPEPLLAVAATRPVWWQRLAYRRPTPEGEDILLHLVSIPETENVDVTRKENPPAATASVTLRLPAGATLRKALALQPRLYRPGVDSKYGAGLDVGGAPAAMTRAPDPADPKGTKWVHKTGALCRAGPRQVEVRAVVRGGEATVAVPEFVYHSLIVFRLVMPN